MIKKLLIFACTVTVSYCCLAQTFHKLEEQAILSNVSRNGKWAFGSLSSVGTYLYDVTNKRLTFFEGSEYYATDVSGYGELAGQFQEVPAIYTRNGEWIPLPIPEGPISGAESARGISHDGKIICGHIDVDASRRPCLWTLQEDGSYSFEILPSPEKDLTNRTPQAIDALMCSTNGDIIGGRLVDYSGGINLPVYWKKNVENKWEYHLLGKDIVFKAGVEIPSIPEFSEAPNAMSYFTKNDSIEYQKAVDEYEASHSGSDPAWDKYNYITNPDSITAYNAAVTIYNTTLEEINEILEIFYTTVLTGETLDVFALQLSGNGRYITSTIVRPDPNANPDDWGGGDLISPMYFDTETGKAVIVDFITDAINDGITDNGDFFYATPNQERARTGFVIPAGSKTPVEFTEWVKQQSKGILDIKPELLFSFEYMDMKTMEMKSAVDSLITGDVFPSADGKIILGSQFAPTDEGFVNYIVDLNNPQGVEDISGDKADVTVYPNPAKNILYLKGNVESVRILDLTGRTVYRSFSISGSIDISSFLEGTYLVELTADGKITTRKVLVTN